MRWPPPSVALTLLAMARLHLGWRWLVLGWPWGKPVWLVPLAFAVASLAFAIWIGLWATLGLRGAPWITTGFVPGDAPVLVGMAGVVATGAAILAGVGELYEAIPPQKLRFEWLRSRGPTDDLWTIRLAVYNAGSFVARYRVVAAMASSNGRVVRKLGEVVFPGTDLVPDNEELSVPLGDFSHDDIAGSVIVVLYWTDRSRHRRSTHLKLPKTFS